MLRETQVNCSGRGTRLRGYSHNTLLGVESQPKKTVHRHTHATTWQSTQQRETCHAPPTNPPTQTDPFNPTNSSTLQQALTSEWHVACQILLGRQPMPFL